MIVFTPRPNKCDLCNRPFPTTKGVVMVDGPSADSPRSPWACMCWACWTSTRATYSFGPGKGQRYTQNENGQFVLTDGGLE